LCVCVDFYKIIGAGLIDSKIIDFQADWHFWWYFWAKTRVCRTHTTRNIFRILLNNIFRQDNYKKICVKMASKRQKHRKGCLEGRRSARPQYATCEMKWAAANWTAIVSKYFFYNFIDTIYILAKRKIRMPLAILEMEMTTKRDSTQRKSACI